MAFEPPTERETQKLDAICERFGVAGQFEIFMKRNWANQGTSFRTVTVRHRKSGATESYYADNPADSPRHWLHLLGQAFAEKTFGTGRHQSRSRASIDSEPLGPE
jgi:hypothetical protein